MRNKNPKFKMTFIFAMFLNEDFGIFIFHFINFKESA